MPHKTELFAPSVSFPLWCVAFSLASLLAFFAVPHLIVKGLLAIAFTLFTTAAVAHRVSIQRVLVRAGFVLDLLVWLAGDLAAKVISALRLNIHAKGQSGLIVALTLLVAAAIGALWPAAQAWYPLVIPNDYYELDDSFRVKSPRGDVYLNRSDLLRCLDDLAASAGQSHDVVPKSEAIANSEWRCPASRADLKEIFESATRALMATSGAQGETGRIFYHHSYIFVPARHLLAYGLDGKIPYLYGYGNTFFHAALMSLSGGTTLTNYFNTLPLAELIGLLAVVAVVSYGTRSIFAALTGFALGLAAFYTISFSALLLAASFSPLRYLGLAVQLASILFVFRGPPRGRSFAIPLAMAVSFFWNREFAILGSLGQGLALLSPSLALPRLQRFGLLALSIVIAAVCALGASISPDITNTISLGFLNIGIPLMSAAEGASFFLVVFGAQAVFTYIAFQSRAKERDARLCILPVLALVVIKYLFNPAPPHLSFVGVLLLPMALVFFRWPGRSQATAKRKDSAWIVQASAAGLALAASLWAGLSFLQGAQDFQRLMVGDFVAKGWTTLGETMRTVTPEAPIAQRVMAIRKEMKPEDKLLVLSPFDHVLSFYVNPQGFCGHFDLLTNIGSRANVQSVLTCARNSPNVLIVYDVALETPCPELAGRVLDIRTKCPHKLTIKRNIQTLMANMKPSVTTVSSVGDLTFYRLRAGAAESPVHSVQDRKTNN